jgi:hypothetical protein
VESANINRKKDSDTIALNFVGDLSASGLHNRKNYDFKTRLSTNLKLEGQLSSPKINGSTNIYGFKVTSPLLGQSLYIRAGYVEFVDNSIRPRNLEIDWGSSKIYLSGEANKIFDPELALSYKIDPLAFAEISSAFVSTQGITLTGNGTAKGNIIGRLNDFSVKGSLNVPDFKIEAPLDNESNEKYLFPFKNLSASYNYAKETIQIKPVKTEIFGGKLSGQGKVFAFSNPVKFELNASGHSLKAENFLSTNTTQNNVVSGPFSVNLQAHGNALGLKTLNGKGNFLMNNGRYQTPPVVTPLLSLINLQEFASGPIETGKGTFNLKSGILSTQDLVFVANAGKAYYRGQIGLDTSLSGKMTIMFSQQAVAKSHTLKQISLNDRTANIPTRVEGTLLEPSFPGFGPEKLLELGLRRKGQKMLQDILSPQKNREADNNDNQKEDKKRKPEQQIIDGLKDIFKF